MLKHLPPHLRKQQLDYMKQNNFIIIEFPTSAQSRLFGKYQKLWLLVNPNENGKVVYGTSNAEALHFAQNKIEKYELDHQYISLEEMEV